MSANPTTPSPNAKPTGASTGTNDGFTETPVRLFRFDSDILDLIVNVLETNGTGRATLRKGIDVLFLDHWRVTKWTDLRVFTSEDVSTTIASGTGIPKESSTPLTIKMLGYVVDYSEIGTLSADVSIDDIISAVKATRRGLPVSGVADSPTRKGVQVIDKKAVPTLEKFSGLDEAFFAWKTSTMNTIGQAGFGRFLSDETIESSCFDGIRYGTRNLTKIFCTFYSVLTIAK